MRLTFYHRSLIIVIAWLALAAGPSASAAGAATKISLDPATATISAAGSQTYAVIASTTDGSTIDVTDQSTLSTNDPLGTVTGPVYTPGKAGDWSVQASYQSFTTTTAVTVTPGNVIDVVVNPNSDPEIVPNGKSTTFSATAYDVKNNLITGSTVTWSVIGNIGTIDDNGVFTAKAVGTGKVQAATGSITSQVSVVVSQPIVTNTVVAPTVKPAVNRNTNTANINTAVTPASTTPTAPAKCTTLKPWAWVMLLAVFLIVVALMYGLVSVTNIWPAAIALGAAGVLAYIQRTYACDGQPWWAWAVTLGTIAITAVAVQSRPQVPPKA